MVDQRRRNIINCHLYEGEENPVAIKRFQKQDAFVSQGGELEELIDLDNSVFMNFKRYTKQDVANCFEADMRSANFEAVIKDDEEVSKFQTKLSFCTSF